MDVIFVTYKDSALSGGSIRVLEALCKSYKKLGVSFKIIFIYGEPGILGGKFYNDCIFLNSKQGYAYLSLLKILFNLIKFKPKIVHFIDPAYWVQLLLIFTSFASVAHIHGGFWSKPRSLRTRLMWLISRLGVGNFIAITFGARDQILANSFTSSEKISVVYNSFSISDENSTEVCRGSIRKKFGIPDEAIVMGSVGRLVGGRGFEDLIRTMSYLDAKWHALLVGDGPKKNDLMKLVMDMGLESRIHLVGSVDDVVPYYQAMDVYGFFARYESFGIALADAMVMKKPIFGLIGAGEYFDPRCPLITSQNSTMIVRPNPRDQWRVETNETILKLVGFLTEYQVDKMKFSSKTDEAYKLVIENFNPSIQAAGVIEVYKKCNKNFKINNL